MMGPAGAGKTTVGRALATAVGWPFLDGDDRHPPVNVEKMRRGAALTDADRAPWLASLHAAIVRTLDRREHLVMACSALKRSYRDVLRGNARPVRFVYLKTAPGELSRRLTTRPGHFAGPNLLAGQLATLEEPDDTEAFTVDATWPEEQIVGAIVREFGL